MGNERELEIIKFETARNEAADAYFKARPQLLRTISEEKMFETGFRMGWEAKEKQGA